MRVEAQLSISGSRAATWAVITDIAHAAEIFSGIEKIEMVAQPANDLVGLRWRETRMLFGKPATAEKWITAAVEQESYTTRAESDGFVFLTTLRLVEQRDGLCLVSSHVSEPQTFVARLQAIMIGLLFKGVIRKAILQDLRDIKAAVERAAG